MESKSQKVIDTEQKIAKIREEFERTSDLPTEEGNKVKVTGADGAPVETAMGTVYDFNKTYIETNGKDMSKYALRKKIEDITKNFVDGFYYMLLCREKHDYTVIRYRGDRKEANEVLKDCIMNRGACREINLVEDGYASSYEIWLYDYDAKEANVYYLFCCNNCVCEC